jgi:hypothetical protein
MGVEILDSDGDVANTIVENALTVIQDGTINFGGIDDGLAGLGIRQVEINLTPEGTRSGSYGYFSGNDIFINPNVKYDKSSLTTDLDEVVYTIVHEAVHVSKAGQYAVEKTANALLANEEFAALADKGDGVEQDFIYQALVNAVTEAVAYKSVELMAEYSDGLTVGDPETGGRGVRTVEEIVLDELTRVGRELNLTDDEVLAIMPIADAKTFAGYIEDNLALAVGLNDSGELVAILPDGETVPVGGTSGHNDAPPTILDRVLELGEDILEFIVEGAKAIGEAIVKGAKEVIDAINETIEAVGDALSGAWDAAKDAFTDIVDAFSGKSDNDDTGSDNDNDSSNAKPLILDLDGDGDGFLEQCARVSGS